MTSEVVVMNRSAVALAADSASTISGAGESKVWNSANKLFSLSRSAPIAVMIYNSAGLMGMPWETVIKNFRKFLGSTTYPTVSEYACALINWIQTTYQSRMEQSEERFFRSSCNQLFQKIVFEFRRATYEGQEPELSKIIKSKYDELKQLEIANCFNEEDCLSIRRKFFASAMQEAIGVLTPYNGTENDAETMAEIGLMLSLSINYGSDFTGVALAGFGEIEDFPSMDLIYTGQFLCGKIKHSIVKHIEIDDNTPSHVETLAQSEMGHTFLYGISNQFLGFTIQTIAAAFFNLPQALAASLKKYTPDQQNEWKQEVQPLVVEALNTCFEGIRQYRQENYYNLVLNTLVHLPKDELANIAETLVHLNAFRKKVSMDAETVGGPIDVVVVSKGDGLIWVKRKHYFDPALNPQFFRNHFGGMERAER